MAGRSYIGVATAAATGEKRLRNHDPDLYVSTFSEDGILDVGSGEITGRQAIKDVIARMPNPAPTAGLRPAVGRHNISNKGGKNPAW